ncbi:MAG: hypothetical protein U5K32_12555 [Bacteroidales bacterium]|nr:hypothetical protein [Bacteroidales bacterium]
MKKSTLIFKLAFWAVVVVVSFSSCTSIHKTMKEPNVRVDLTKSDFELSEQVTGEAKVIRVLGIDWARLFRKTTADIQPVTSVSSLINLSSIPVIGNIITDKSSGYALYKLMKDNPGYDVVFFPQFSIDQTRYLFVVKIINVKATARLGKLKDDDR